MVVVLVAVMGAVAFLVPLSATQLGASPALLGLIMSVSSVGSLLAAVPAGVLVDRAGTRMPLAASCVVAAISAGGIALGDSITSIFVFFSLFRVAEIVVFVSFQAHVAGMAEGAADTTRGFGWYGFAASLGQLLGPAAAGYLLETAGEQWSWGLSALAFLGTGALALVLVASAPRSSARGGAAPLQGPLAMLRGGAFRRVLSGTAIVAVVASFVIIFAGGSRGTYFPVFLTTLGYTPSVAGMLVAVGALAGLASRVLLSSLVRVLRGSFPTMLWSFAVMTVGMGLTPFCRSIPALAINSFLVGIGGGVALPLSMATVAEGAPEGMRAVAMGVRLTGNRLAALVNPLVFGAASALWGVPSAFVAAAIVLLGSTVGLGLWWLRRGRVAA